jgi:hypothetical protein
VAPEGSNVGKSNTELDFQATEIERTMYDNDKYLGFSGNCVVK